MNKHIRHSIDYLLIAAMSLFFGWLSGRVDTDIKGTRLFVTVSIKTGEATDQLRYDAETSDSSFSSNLLLSYASRNVVSTSFPKTKELKNLRFEIEPKESADIYGLMISQGSFLKVFTPQEILSAFSFENCDVESKSPNSLSIKSIDPDENVSFNLASSISVEEAKVDWTIFSYSALIALFLISLIYYLKYRNTSIFAGAWISSSILLFLSVAIMNELKESVKNSDLFLTSNIEVNDDTKFDLFYSRQAGFHPLKIIQIEELQLDGSLKLSLPPAIHRHLRLDLPVNDTIVLSQLRLEHWWADHTINASDLLTYFPLNNDIEVGRNEKGEVLLFTGPTDPFIQLANSDLQGSFAKAQQKKREYPFFFGMFFFLGFLIIFSLPGNFSQRFFLSLFSAFILIPICSLTVKEDQTKLENEKRFAGQKPKSYDNLVLFKNETENYLKDQFGGRSSLITNWNVLKILAYGETNNVSPVLMGKENWMFYKDEGLKELYENKTKYTQEELAKMLHVVEERRKWLALYGIDYFMVFPPVKHSIYPEYYPENIEQVPGPNKMDQVIDHLKSNSETKIIDLRNCLLDAKAKEERDIYYKTDSHWNLLGSYYAYVEIMESIKDGYPEIGELKEKSDFIWEESENQEGDLAKLVAMNKIFKRMEIVPVPIQGYEAALVPSKYYPTYESPHLPVTMENPNIADLKMVMNRDSYTNFLIPFMSEHFSRSVYLWTPLFNPIVIKEEMPDIMVTEMLERFLQDLMINNPAIMRQELDLAFDSLTSSF